MGLTEAREKMKSKGTVGLFTKKAHADGKSVQEFAKEKSHSKNPKLREEAAFAKGAGKGFKKH